MTPRPTSITVIGWLEIVGGVIGLLAALGMVARRNGPNMLPTLERIVLPMPIHIAIAFLGAALGLVCGIGLLHRQNWARFLYVGWWLVSFVYSIIIFRSYMPFFLIPSVVIFLIFIYFLFRPVATQYFTGNGAHDNL